MDDQFVLDEFRVSPDLVVVHLQAETAAEAIAHLSEILIDRGYARPSYTQAAIEREMLSPTGLPLDGVKTAIPHAGPEHALKPGVAIATLAHPVLWGELGDPDSQIEVSIVFLLCVSRPEAQVYLLQSLVEVYKDTALLERLWAAADSTIIVEEVNASLARVQRDSWLAKRGEQIMAKKIITACGLACSMAPLIARKIQERLKAEKISGIEIQAAKVPELASVAPGAICIVTTMKIRQDYGVPVIDGSEFIMGGDGQETLDKVMALVKAAA